MGGKSFAMRCNWYYKALNILTFMYDIKVYSKCLTTENDVRRTYRYLHGYSNKFGCRRKCAINELLKPIKNNC